MNHEEEKGKAAVGRICRKGRFKNGMKESVGDRIPNNSKYDCWQITTVYTHQLQYAAGPGRPPICADIRETRDRSEVASSVTSSTRRATFRRHKFDFYMYRP